MTEMLAAQDLNDGERMMFLSQINAARKDPTTGVLLALLLGGLGAHKFWQGKVGLGVLYLLFCWTFIPAVAGLIEAFLMSGWCKKYNEQKAMEIAATIRAMRRSGGSSSAQLG
jgi:TM2 domain-containing membrane protein YozV